MSRIKLFSPIIILIISLLLSSSCKSRKSDSNLPASWIEGSASIIIWTDRETGCQYLVTKYRLASPPGITPRLSREGKPICKGE